MTHRLIVVRADDLSTVSHKLVQLDVAVALVTRFVNEDTYGLFRLLACLDDVFSASKLAERALAFAIPQLTVGMRKARSLPPDYSCLFSTARIPSSVPLVIFLNADLAKNGTIAPRWVRDMLGAPERKTVQLIALNAYVSTLGGGHYLCKHVGEAWNMALRQQAIAIALGDDELAGQCRVHLAYICMQTGQLKAAARRLQLEKMFADRIGSSKLHSVVYAAQTYLSKLQLKADELRYKPQDRLRDGLYRQRFVELKMQRVVQV